jgi:hypothetical protein
VAIATYTDVNDFITGQGITLRAGAGTTFVQARINAAESRLNTLTGKSYVSAAEVRKYDGTGTPSLAIDPCLAVTSVVLTSFGTTIHTYAATDYLLYPANSNPKFELRRDNSGVSTIRDYLSADAGESRVYYWPKGDQNVWVTGTWADAASAPADYKEAVIILAALYVLAGDNLPTISGSVAAAVKSYKTGVFSATFADTSQKDMIAKISGWGDFIKETINIHRKAWVG